MEIPLSHVTLGKYLMVLIDPLAHGKWKVNWSASPQSSGAEHPPTVVSPSLMLTGRGCTFSSRPISPNLGFKGWWHLNENAVCQMDHLLIVLPYSCSSSMGSPDLYSASFSFSFKKKEIIPRSWWNCGIFITWESVSKITSSFFSWIPVLFFSCPVSIPTPTRLCFLLS